MLCPAVDLPQGLRGFPCRAFFPLHSKITVPRLSFSINISASQCCERFVPPCSCHTWQQRQGPACWRRSSHWFFFFFLHLSLSLSFWKSDQQGSQITGWRDDSVPGLAPLWGLSRQNVSGGVHKQLGPWGVRTFGARESLLSPSTPCHVLLSPPPTPIPNPGLISSHWRWDTMLESPLGYSYTMKRSRFALSLFCQDGYRLLFFLLLFFFSFFFKE